VVPVVDLSRRGQRFASSFAAASERIAASGSFLLGAELSAFETEFADWLGASHCVGVSSGAAALQLALAAADRLRDKYGESAVSLASGMRGRFRERTHENPASLPGKNPREKK